MFLLWPAVHVRRVTDVRRRERSGSIWARYRSADQEWINGPYPAMPRKRRYCHSWPTRRQQHGFTV